MSLTETAGLLGNVGEFFGAIAVFITLAYLAIQIRHSAKAERSTAYDASIKNFMSVRQLTIETSEMATIFYEGNNDPLSLNELELFRYRVLLNNIFLSYWHIYTQPEELHKELWATQQASLIRLMSSAGGKWFWEHYQLEFVEAFRQEVEMVLTANPDTRKYS